MTIGELQEQLEMMLDYGSDTDTEVILGTQPSYPLASAVESVVVDEETGNVVITAGNDIGYGKRTWWEGY